MSGGNNVAISLTGHHTIFTMFELQAVFEVIIWRYLHFKNYKSLSLILESSKNHKHICQNLGLGSKSNLDIAKSEFPLFVSGKGGSAKKESELRRE